MPRSIPLFSAALVVTLLAACSTAPEQTAPVDNQMAASASTASGATPTAGASVSGLGTGSAPLAQPIASAGSAGMGAAAGGMDPALSDPRSQLSKRSIYFDYDVFAVRDEFKPLLEAHAAYLKRNPQAR
ncbi:MAG: hypothetical protein ACK4XK_05210, partial [Casimicrobiaceae bacterium]